MSDPNVIEEAPKPNPSTVHGRGALVPSTQPISGGVAGFSDPVEGRADERSGNFQVPQTNVEAVTPKPQGFALSLAPVRIEPPVAVGKKPTGNTPVKPNRIWAVQVAAFAENNDAESFAGKIRFRFNHHRAAMPVRPHDSADGDHGVPHGLVVHKLD